MSVREMLSLHLLLKRHHKHQINISQNYTCHGGKTEGEGGRGGGNKYFKTNTSHGRNKGEGGGGGRERRGEMNNS